MKDDLWFVAPDTDQLVSSYRLPAGAKTLPAATPITVSIDAVVVADDHDKSFLRGDNDIFVTSKASLGPRPPVELIHYYKEEVPEDKLIRNMLSNTVFVTDDYSGLHKLWMQINVVEVDTSDTERAEALAAFESLLVTTGGVFPALTPFAAAASGAAGALNMLMGALESDEHVINTNIALYPGKSRPGHAPLQPGTYVCFARELDASDCTLAENGRVLKGGEDAKATYAVLNLSTTEQVSPEFVVSQKLATLLTQMNKGNPSSPVATLNFLSDTLTQYANFKKLDRYTKLKAQETLTAEEKALMGRIENIDALKPFLPKG